MYNLLTNNLSEYVRERQRALQAEAARHRLLHLAAQQIGHLTPVRQLALVVGTLLISAGVWFKQHATRDQNSADRQPVIA